MRNVLLHSEIGTTGTKKGGKTPIWINEDFFYGELLLSEASDQSPPALFFFFAAVNITVITSVGLLPLFIYLPLQEAVINLRWQIRGVVSSPKTLCLIKYICLINASLSSAVFSLLWQGEIPPGGKAKAFKDTHEPFSHVFMAHLWTHGVGDSWLLF